MAAVIALSIVYRYLDKALDSLAASSAPLAGPLILVLLGIVTLVAVAHRRYRYDDIWLPLRVLVRGAGAVVFAQICFDALYPAAMVSNIFIGTFFDARILAGVALLVGAVAMARPAFLVPMLLAYICFRFRAPVIFGLEPTQLDFTTLCDVALFPMGVLLLWRTVAYLKPAPGRIVDGLFNDPLALRRIQKLMWGLCIGIHLGNYFHSAIAKLQVGGGDELFWILHNPTGQAVIYGLSRMNGPLAGWPSLLQHYYDGLTAFSVPLNIAVFVLQIAAPLSVLHRRLLIAFTLAFDMLHLGIYASLGAFFFFWIALNVIVLLSLRAARDSDFTLPVKVTAMIAALFGYLSFSTAELGWLDGRKVVRELVIARRVDGTKVIVPPAAFGLFAYQIGHGNLYVPAGHFQVRFGGAVYRQSEWRDAAGCGRDVKGEQRLAPRDGIDQMILTADRFYRNHPWIRSYGLEYFYPHHMPSNPVFFGDYDATPMRNIIGYSYLVESGCPGLVDGRLKDDIRVHTEHTVPAGSR